MSQPSILNRLFRRFVLTPLGYGRPTPAPVFDREFTSGKWDKFQALSEQGRQLLVAGLAHRLHANPTILDVGCGDGHFATLLQPSRYRHYLGVDLSPVAVATAQKRTLPNCEFVEASFEQWLPGSRFDVIIFNECLGYAHDPGAIVGRLASSLTPQGRFIVSHFRSGYWRALWRRIDRNARTIESFTVTNSGRQTWDIRILEPQPHP